MKFVEHFKITEPVDGRFSLVDQLSDDDTVLPGQYNNGVLCLLDEEQSGNFNELRIFKSVENLTVFGFTGFGDVFCFEQSVRKVIFYEPQYDRFTTINKDIKEFFDLFLVDENIRQKLLKETYFADVIAELKQPIRYGEILILEPWLLIGGKDDPRNYIVGSCLVYVELVCQTLAAG